MESEVRQSEEAKGFMTNIVGLLDSGELRGETRRDTLTTTLPTYVPRYLSRWTYIHVTYVL